MIRLTYREDYPGGRQVALLGEIAIGAIFPDIPPVRWTVWLPNHSGQAGGTFLTARSVEQAHALVAAKVADWLKRADILSLAERDRADAATLPLFAEPTP